MILMREGGRFSPGRPAPRPAVSPAPSMRRGTCSPSPWTTWPTGWPMCSGRRSPCGDRKTVGGGSRKQALGPSRTTAEDWARPRTARTAPRPVAAHLLPRLALGPGGRLAKRLKRLADPTRFERATFAFGVGSFTVVIDLDDLRMFEVSALSVVRCDELLIYDLRPSALTGYPVVTPDFGADN
jgi:hypothetical protein